MASVSNKAKPDDEERKDVWGKEAKRFFAIKPRSADLKMNRANEYATPTHNARRTRVYSVSFPVCIV